MRKHALAAAALAALAVAGCKKERAEPAEPEERSEAKSPAPAAKEAPPKKTRTGAIEWIQDDYPAALAQAKEAKKPLVIDMWAPWCHTCISMKHHVLSDPGLAPMADRFVWVALDTDKETNAGAVAKFNVDVWPTFYVVSPEDESVQSRHLGAGSVKELREFLDQGEKGHLAVTAEAGELAEDSLLWHVRAGDHAAAMREPKEAAESYLKAIEAAPEDYIRLPSLLVSTVSSLYHASEWKDCAEFAAEHLEQAKAGNTAAAADFAYYGAECAGELLDKGFKRRLLKDLMAAIEDVLEAKDAALSMDDRSWALLIEREMALVLDDADKARELAERQREILDRAFEDAPSAYAAMTYGFNLAEVYVYLGEPEKVVPKLEELVEKLPNEYDPYHRLAWVYHKMGEQKKALALANKSRELVYGPRAARIQSLIVSIHKASGDRDAAIEAQEELVEIYEELPDAQKDPGRLARAKEKLAALEKK